MLNKFIGSALIASSLLMVSPVFAAEGGKMMGEKMIRKSTNAVDVACVAKAMDARELGLSTAFSTFASTQSSALSTRRTALTTAWGLTETSARNTAITAAWSAYRTAHRDAVKAHVTAARSTDTAFRTAAKVCKGGASAAATPADSSLAAQ